MDPVPIFNHLDAEQMHEIMLVTHSVHYKKGENMYRAGEWRIQASAW